MPNTSGNTELREEDFDIVADNNDIRVTSKDGIFVQSSNYHTLKESIRNEIAESAEILNRNELIETKSENMAKAELLYMDKMFQYTSNVLKIESDYCVLSSSTSDEVNVCLAKDELAKLSNGAEVTVYGYVTYINSTFAQFSMYPAFVY